MSHLSLSGVAVFLLAAAAISQSVVVVADSCCGPCSEADEPKGEPSAVVRSISETSEALARETDRVFDPATIRRTPTFKLLAGTRNLTLWNELLVRPGDNPALPILGLMCIEHQRPELSFDAAVRCIIVSPRPGNPLMGYAAEILGKGAKDRNSTDRIARIIESGAGSDDAVVVLLSALPRDNLIACFDALDVDQCSASRLAWVVSAIGEKSLDGLDGKIKTKYRAALETLADTPGISRCTYLSLVDHQAKNVKECLRLAILDPDVKEIYLIPPLRRFGKVYAKDLDGWLASTSEKRQAFVRKILSR